MITDINKKVRKIRVGADIMEIKPEILGGEYNLESVELEDGTQKMVATYEGKYSDELTNVNEFELPEEFGEWQEIFYFILPDKNVLFSGRKGNAAVGIWLYEIDKREITQLYNERYNWRYFQAIGGDCLISGDSNATGLLLYEGETKTIRKIFDGSYTLSFKLLDGLCYMYSNAYRGILVYNPSSKTVERIYDEGANWEFYQKINEKYLITSNYSNGLGVLLYDPSNKSVRKIYEEDYLRKYFSVVGNDCLIGCTDKAEGILLFRGDTETVEKIYVSGKMWQDFQSVDGGCLISGRDSTATGVLFYSSDTKEITPLYSEGYKWQYFRDVGTGYLISSSDKNSAGLLFYDNVLKTVEKIHETGYDFQHVFLLDDVFLVTTEDTSVKGLIFYDPAAGVVETKLTTGYKWKCIIHIEDRYLISSEHTAGSTGIYMYIPASKTFEKIFGYDQAFTNSFKVAENKYLLTGPSNGILSYDITTNEIVRLQSQYSWRYAYYFENSILFCSSGSSTHEIKEYNLETGILSTRFTGGYGYSVRDTLEGRDVLIGSTTVYDIVNNQLYPTLRFENNLINFYTYTKTVIFDMISKKFKLLKNYYSQVQIVNNDFLYMFTSNRLKFAVVDCRR